MPAERIGPYSHHQGRRVQTLRQDRWHLQPLHTRWFSSFPFSARKTHHENFPPLFLQIKIFFIMQKNSNKSKKRTNTSYVRLSMRLKMKRMRDSKTLPLSPRLMVVFRSKKFPFIEFSDTPLTFCQKFCSYFIFDKGFLEAFIPTPYCNHLYVSSALVVDLLKSKPILHLMHKYYHTQVERSRGSAPEAFYGHLNFDAKRPSRRKSERLPFLLSTADFYEEV